MASYNHEISDNVGGGWLIGALIIFFLLFRDGFGHRGHGGGEHGHIRNGGYYELNYEQDYKLIKEQNEHDRRVVGEIVKPAHARAMAVVLIIFYRGDIYVRSHFRRFCRELFQ